ncbi:MAG: transporter [Gammaproteobacteria bacterium]|nr:transporter [Gammaproteobacteria bacterium]
MRRLPLYFAVFAYLATPSAWAAPQTFNTALPVAEGEFIFREQLFAREATDDPSAANRELQVLGAISVLGYGVHRDLSVFGVLPALNKELDVTTSAGTRITRETSGIGDARLFARYTVYQRDTPGRTFRLAPFLGIKGPTGDDDERDSLGTLPAPLQLGSGSWDPFGGLVLTYQTLQYQVDAQASYKANTEANKFTFGDEARLDASLQYRLWPRQLDAGVPGFLYGVLESNLLYREKNRGPTGKDSNSGGASIFLSPGLQYVTKRWIVESIVQLPLVQNLNGRALEDDFTFRAGFRVNF